MSTAEREAFEAMRTVLLTIESAPRTHPDRNGANYWQYNLIPRTIERMRDALSKAENAIPEPSCVEVR